MNKNYLAALLTVLVGGTTVHGASLTASDGAAYEEFGYSVSQSGSIGLVGASGDDGPGGDMGSAYVFRNLDTATGTVTENVKLLASDRAGMMASASL